MQIQRKSWSLISLCFSFCFFSSARNIACGFRQESMGTSVEAGWLFLFDVNLELWAVNCTALRPICVSFQICTLTLDQSISKSAPSGCRRDGREWRRLVKATVFFLIPFRSHPQLCSLSINKEQWQKKKFPGCKSTTRVACGRPSICRPTFLPNTKRLPLLLGFLFLWWIWGRILTHHQETLRCDSTSWFHFANPTINPQLKSICRNNQMYKYLSGNNTCSINAQFQRAFSLFDVSSSCIWLERWFCDFLPLFDSDFKESLLSVESYLGRNSQINMKERELPPRKEGT